MANLKDKFKVNWKIIIIHLLATSLLIIAAKQIGMLRDPDFYESLEKSGFKDTLKSSSGEEGFSQRLFQIFLWERIVPMIALILAGAISVTLAVKSKVSWLNSLIVIISSLVLLRLRVFSSTEFFLEPVFFASRKLMSGVNFEYHLIINGLILASTSLFIFLSRRIRAFIC